MRIPQPVGTKGSLKWIQEMLSRPNGGLERAVRETLGLPANVAIQWKSPRLEDHHAEYRDGSFLRLLGLERLVPELRGFWPSRGPQWDALALTSDDRVILVEAKAHAGELASSCTAGAKSREIIDRALDAAKRYYGARSTADWSNGNYQYANRLAHLQFLRERGVDAHLVFVYFMNDREVGGPSTKAEWAHVLDECHTSLGLPGQRSVPGLHSVFIDVSQR